MGELMANKGIVVAGALAAGVALLAVVGTAKASSSRRKHVVKGDGTDWPSQLAREYTGDPGRWLELCEANPDLARHPEWGCVYPPPGVEINLPASWVD